MEYLTEHEKDMVIGTIYKIVNDNETLIELLDESEIEELNEIGYQMKQGSRIVAMSFCEPRSCRLQLSS